MANSASEIPGATTASDEFSCAPIWKNEFMIPQTVPNKPMKGATEPVVARKPSRSDSLSASCATALSIAVASRWRTPSRSIALAAVERRHSPSPAATIRALGTSPASLPPRSAWKASISLAFQKSRS